MAFTLTTLEQLPSAGFDEIIDVRSPAEFAEDHIPGAASLPVLDDAERARIGRIYVQESRFIARRQGAALVARNAARHLEGYLAAKGPRYRPLVHCWRGGQRSGSFASILSQIGWRVEVLDGGYRAYRRLVSDLLYQHAFPAPVVLLDGNTGCAKTELLHILAARGHQVIDLEGLARHRGSLFGAMRGGQPSQKGFESALAAQVAALDTSRPVLLEAESNKIGDILIPPGLWKAMQTAQRLGIAAPLAERARYLARAYADLTADAAALAGVIDKLRPFHPAEQIDHWQAQAATGAFEALAEGLMALHYDPRYAKSTVRRVGPARRVEADALDMPGLERLAGRVEAALAEMGRAR